MNMHFSATNNGVGGFLKKLSNSVHISERDEHCKQASNNSALHYYYYNYWASLLLQFTIDLIWLLEASRYCQKL